MWGSRTFSLWNESLYSFLFGIYFIPQTSLIYTDIPSEMPLKTDLQSFSFMQQSINPLAFSRLEFIHSTNIGHFTFYQISYLPSIMVLPALSKHQIYLSYCCLRFFLRRKCMMCFQSYADTKKIPTGVKNHSYAVSWNSPSILWEWPV